MLTVEQCTVLRDLGYPQDGVASRSLERLFDGRWVGLPRPSLEELITWLGNDFFSLTYEPAEGFEANGCVSMEDYSGFGKTPLEAVYSLAVAMRGKGDQ